MNGKGIINMRDCFLSIGKILHRVGVVYRAEGWRYSEKSMGVRLRIARARVILVNKVLRSERFGLVTRIGQCDNDSKRLFQFSCISRGDIKIESVLSRLEAIACVISRREIPSQLAIT